MITVKLLQDYGFYVHKTRDGYEIQRYTPAGEDWCLFFTKLNDIKKYSEDFDEEEEFTMWVKAKEQGVAGIPSILELWEDQLWKKNLLKEIVMEIKND